MYSSCVIMIPTKAGLLHSWGWSAKRRTRAVDKRGFRDSPWTFSGRILGGTVFSEEYEILVALDA